jgi:hypothetical protein
MALDTSNSAFDGDKAGPELARILREAADALEAGRVAGRCRDINDLRDGVWRLRRGDDQPS